MSPQDITIPDGPLGFVFRHFWIAFIVATSSNASVAWQRSVQPRIDADPKLEAGYRSLFRSSLVLMNVPWLLMGLGILSGRVSSVHEYLVPSSGNITVEIWWGAMAAFAAAGTVWMLSGGAERLAAHPGLLYIPETTTPERIKWFWMIGCAWNGLFGLLLFLGFPSSLKTPEATSALVGVPFPFLFVGVWLLICLILGHLSGWAGLAKSYREEASYQGPVVTTGGRMGITSYKGIIRLGADDWGLYLSVLFPFRVGHEPLAIPWSAIRVSRTKASFTEYVRFSIGHVVLDVREKDVKRLGRNQMLQRLIAAAEWQAIDVIDPKGAGGFIEDNLRGSRTRRSSAGTNSTGTLQ